MLLLLKRVFLFSENISELVLYKYFSLITSKVATKELGSLVVSKNGFELTCWFWRGQKKKLICGSKFLLFLFCIGTKGLEFKVHNRKKKKKVVNFSNQCIHLLKYNKLGALVLTQYVTSLLIVNHQL